MALVENEQHRYGYIDKTCKEVIPCQWEWSYGFSEGLARTSNDELKMGYIDKKGRVVIPFQWEQALDFSGGIAKVRDKEGECYIDRTGKIILR